MNRMIKILTYCILMLCPILISHGQIYAYSFTGKKICSFNVDYRWGGSIIPTHKTAFEQAIGDWNRVQSKRNIRNGGSTAPGVFDTYTANLKELGVTNIVFNTETNCVIAWAAKLNSFYPDTHYSIIARSVANHEIGHTLGLDHTNNPAIMNINRDRETIYLPQTDDINGVNALY